MLRLRWIAIAFLLFFSCARETEPELPDAKTVTFNASMTSPSRTALGQPEENSWPNHWCEGDVIVVNGVTSEPLAASDAGSSSASFTVTGVSAPYEAFCPSGVTEIPKAQTYVEGSYDPSAFLMRASSETENLDFEIQVSLFRFTPTGDSDSRITGVSVNGFGMTSTEGVQLGKSWFIVIPPGDYTKEGVRIVVNAADGGVMHYGSRPTKVYEAGKMYSLSMDYSPDPGGGIPDAETLRAFLEAPSGDAYLLCDIDLQGESVSAASYDGVFDGRGHIISNPGAPLFASNSGTLKNFTVEGSFEPSEDLFSPVVLNNSGTIENVTNCASVSISRTSSATGSVVIGGIAAYSY